MGKKEWGIIAILLCVLGGGIYSVLQTPEFAANVMTGKDIEQVVFADTKSLVGSLVYVAEEKGYFTDAGLEVIFDTSYAHGRAGIEGLLVGDVQFSAGSETPFMHSGLMEEEIFVLAQTMSIGNHMAIVANRNADIETYRDLRGKNIGVTKGSNGEFYLGRSLAAHNIPIQSITMMHFAPGDLIGALENGEVDALATWFPIHTAAEKRLGKRAITFRDVVYAPYFLIGVQQEYALTHPDQTKGFLEALLRAQVFVETNFADAMAIVSANVGVDKNVLIANLRASDFAVRLDSGLLLTLEQEAKWAIANGLTDAIRVPDYTEMINDAPLHDIDPILAGIRR
ncbi:MAG: ABC transporter substrate-binding protein [Candidatus Magasanikbacteria bacterium]|jgi:NitT/TauT family transport system substrate-binding protein|nr:ABC transporter substrate-binding protein [Candidatus Magasanikbacteria bacterium]